MAKNAGVPTRCVSPALVRWDDMKIHGRSDAGFMRSVYPTRALRHTTLDSGRRGLGSVTVLQFVTGWLLVTGFYWFTCHTHHAFVTYYAAALVRAHYADACYAFAYTLLYHLRLRVFAAALAWFTAPARAAAVSRYRATPTRTVALLPACGDAPLLPYLPAFHTCAPGLNTPPCRRALQTLLRLLRYGLVFAFTAVVCSAGSGSCTTGWLFSVLRSG